MVPFFFPSFFRCHFWSILARFCLPTWLPKSTKIDEKSMPRCLPMLTSFFDRFLIDFYSQLQPPESQKSNPRCSESTIFQKIAFRNWHRFLIDFGANLAPFCLPKIHQNRCKNRSQDASNFWSIFASIFFFPFSSNLGPKLGPCWPLFRRKRGGCEKCSRLLCWGDYLLDPSWPSLLRFW